MRNVGAGSYFPSLPPLRRSLRHWAALLLQTIPQSSTKQTKIVQDFCDRAKPQAEKCEPKTQVTTLTWGTLRLSILRHKLLKWYPLIVRLSTNPKSSTPGHPPDFKLVIRGLTMSQWLRSNKARTLFSYSSWAVMCMGLFMLFMLSPWFQQAEAMPKGELFLRVLGGALGVAGAPASLIIWFGMVAFCLRGDRSHFSTKIFWLILFFTTGPFGAAAYFFIVYREQVQRSDMAGGRVEQPSRACKPSVPYL
jgi:hypothetical protein